MRHRQALELMLVGLLALGTAGCGGDDETGPSLDEFGPMSWTVTLNAASMVGPAINSPGTGTATLDWDGTRLSFVLNVQNMVRINGAHIHTPATVTQDAPIVLNLFVPTTSTGPFSGELARGAAVAGSPLFASSNLGTLLGFMRDNRAYIMVHTDAHPDGEIRGQVVRQP
jgi:hypothetical protein